MGASWVVVCCGAICAAGIGAGSCAGGSGIGSASGSGVTCGS